MSTAPLYKIHPQHRDGNTKKSQWTIPETDERQCFDRAYWEGWQDQPATYWSYYLHEGSVSYLGIAEECKHEPERKLIIAKFVGDSTPQEWHGYPADPQKKQQDVPLPAVLKMWLDKKEMRPAIIRKIGQRKPCSL